VDYRPHRTAPRDSPIPAQHHQHWTLCFRPRARHREITENRPLFRWMRGTACCCRRSDPQALCAREWHATCARSNPIGAIFHAVRPANPCARRLHQRVNGCVCRDSAGTISTTLLRNTLW